MLGLATSELVLRVIDAAAGRTGDFFLPPQDLGSAMYQPHPYMGVAHRPGWSREVGYRIHINSLGLRGSEVERKKPAGTYRIVCIGGSTTFGTAVTDDDRSYPAQLERLLRHESEQGRVIDDRRFEVLNAGVSGYNSADSLINFELRLLALEPDAVISYEGANDGNIIQTRRFQTDYSHMRRAPPLLELSPIERFLLGHVRTYAHLVRGTDPQAQLGALANWVFVPGHEQLKVRTRTWINEEGLGTFLRNMRNLVAVARAHGVLPVLCSFAVKDPAIDSSESYLAPFIIRSNAGLADLAAELDVPLLPVAEKLNGQTDLYDDWMHLNDRGSLRHAEVVLAAASSQGLFGLRPR